MDLLADDAVCIRRLEYCFSSNYAPDTEAFAVILAFCKSSNPFEILNEPSEKVLVDFCRNYMNSLYNDYE